jgi:hypothetical protein
MDILGILLEQVGFVAAILLLIYLISLITRSHISADVEVPPSISDKNS